MSTKPIARELMQQALDAYYSHGTKAAAARALGIPWATYRDRLSAAERAGLASKAKHPDDPQMLKDQIRKLSNDLRAAQAESSDIKVIKSIIGEMRNQVEVWTPPEWTVKPPKIPEAPGVPLLFLSDLHWGEIVHASQINGVNMYNLAIARERLHFTVEKAIELLRILSPKLSYPGIVVPLGGDMISGNIHEELTATNEINSIPSVLDLYGHLCGVISRLVEVFGAVSLPCVTGNHGRDTRKCWGKDRHHTSFDWLLYRFLAKHFENDKRVSFFIPDSSDALFRIYGVRFNLTHGDQFRGGDGIIGPLGPLTRGNQKKQARNQAIDLEYDVMMCGHFHQYMQLSRLIVNGSLKGYDEYAYQNNFGFERPQQALFVTHHRHGITFRMPVNCDPGPKVEKTAWFSHPTSAKPKAL